MKKTNCTVDDLSARVFVQHCVPDRPVIDQNVDEWLRNKYSTSFGFGLDCLFRTGCFRIAGWEIDFRPHLNWYWYKQYGSIYQGYAPNKTMLRTALSGHVSKIVKV